jgi:hypothetical protein
VFEELANDPESNLNPAPEPQIHDPIADPGTGIAAVPGKEYTVSSEPKPVVRALLVCTEKLQHLHGTVVKLHAQYDQNDPVNKAFQDASPSGSFEISIAKGRPAADAFIIGQAYYLDFTPRT